MTAHDSKGRFASGGGGKGKSKGGAPKASAKMHANTVAHNAANGKLFKKPSGGGASKIRPAAGHKPIKTVKKPR